MEFSQEAAASDSDDDSSCSAIIIVIQISVSSFIAEAVASVLEPENTSLFTFLFFRVKKRNLHDKR